jgi:hypothetical protein
MNDDRAARSRAPGHESEEESSSRRYFDPVNRAWAAAGATSEEQRRRATAPEPSPVPGATDAEREAALWARIEVRLLEEREVWRAVIGEVIGEMVRSEGDERTRDFRRLSQQLADLREAVGDLRFLVRADLRKNGSDWPAAPKTETALKRVV